VAEPGEHRRVRGVVMTSRRMLVIFAVVVVAFTAVAFRTEINQRGIARNQQEIGRNARLLQRVVYDQCTVRNQGTARQNVLIDSAIAAERRKPAPDEKRLKDLTDFRGVIVDCGRRPP
jgi:hypothetical protein